MAEAQYARRTARVLLLDLSGRILLLKYAGQNGDCWLTPGGAVDNGETPREAAARELREEVGLAVDPDRLGPAVAECFGYADLSWVRGRLRDDFFLHRVDGHLVDTTGQDSYERDALLGHRWWTVDELAATTETVFPFGLVPLLTQLIAGRMPPKPVTLPWHH